MDDSSSHSSSRGSDAPPPPEGRLPLHHTTIDHNNDYNQYPHEGGNAVGFYAQPPAGAPPTPPPTPPSWYGKHHSGIVVGDAQQQNGGGGGSGSSYQSGGIGDFASSSYQHAPPTSKSGAAAGEAEYTGSRQAVAPMIRYEDELQADPGKDTSGTAAHATNSFRGDATLRPNVGLTNSYDNALFGWTLMELVHNLRIANLTAASLTLFWVFFSWLGKLLLLKLHEFVLLCYLAVLTLALLVVEIMGFYRTQLSQRGITSNNSTHTFVMEERVRDQLGLLYHPGGKAGYILFLAVLCLSMEGIFLNIVAFLYCCSAFGYIYAYNAYPEFRRGYTPPVARSSNNARNMWNMQSWTTTSLTGRGLAEAAARNWSSRWGLGTGPEEEPTETESFLRHNQASQTYTYV